MNLLTHFTLKKAFLILQLFTLISSLHAAEYSINDPEDLITDEQEETLQKSQADILAEQDTLVSYAFYNVNASKNGMRMTWESALEKAATKGKASDKFHLLICVGIFSKRNTVDIYYQNQPALQDVNDLSTYISSLKQSLASEPDLIESAPDIIKDRISYLNARPKYEEQEKKTADETRTQAFMDYIYRLVKIGLFIIVPIIALLVFWYILSSINNRRPHHFPAGSHPPPRKRLGAPYAATSISKNNN